jgi:hypothetical protein
MAENIETFGFENEEIRGGFFEKYKGKKGEIHRTAIVYADLKTMFAGSKIHYANNRYFLCKKGLCCEKCGPAKWRVGSVIVKYATDRNGAIKQPFGYELMPWVFGEQTYVKLKTVNSEFPLASHDLKISCENDDYQHLSFAPCNESIWLAKDELKRKILEDARPIWESVKKSIASDLSIEEIKDLLGAGTTGGGSDPTTNLNLDQVLASV